MEAKDLVIKYEGKQITKALNFKIQRGDRIVLNGVNGSGKSSIIKKIMNTEMESGGQLLVGSGLKISYVAQDTSFLKGSINEFAASLDLDITLFKAILRKLDFERSQFDKNMEDFSAGQKKKVLLAKSLCEQAHLYIWDEPLNYIDVFSRLQIEELILEYKPTMLFVEHDIAFVDKVSTGKINVYRV